MSGSTDRDEGARMDDMLGARGRALGSPRFPLGAARAIAQEKAHPPEKKDLEVGHPDHLRTHSLRFRVKGSLTLA
jgi:hypothetical protein